MVLYYLYYNMYNSRFILSFMVTYEEKKERCHQDTLPRILYICDSDNSYSSTKSDTGLPAL